MTAVLAPSASGQRCASTHLASCVCALLRCRGHGKKYVKSQRVPSYAGIRNVYQSASIEFCSNQVTTSPARAKPNHTPTSHILISHSCVRTPPAPSNPSHTRHGRAVHAFAPRGPARQRGSPMSTSAEQAPSQRTLEIQSSLTKRRPACTLTSLAHATLYTAPLAHTHAQTRQPFFPHPAFRCSQWSGSCC